MGIFAVEDMGGIDLSWRVWQEYQHLDKPGERVPIVLEKLYHLGRLGQKSGAGWYRYGADRKPIADPEVETLIDTIYLAGYGFPAYRGGPMWYADTVGLEKILQRILVFREHHGPSWEPAPLLKRLAAEGKTFAGLG